MSRYQDTIDKLRMQDKAKERIKAQYGKSLGDENLHKELKSGGAGLAVFHFRFRSLAAVAACLVLFWMLGSRTIGFIKPEAGWNRTGKPGTEAPAADNNTDDNSSMIQGKTNGFTMLVQAKEMEKGNFVALSLEQPWGSSWGQTNPSEGGPAKINYQIHAPFQCKGSNIKEIQYEINQGAFQITEPKDSPSILKDYTLASKELDVGSIGAMGSEVDEEGELLSNVLFCTSFSILEKDQGKESVYISICDEKETKAENYFGDTPQENADALNELLNGVVITCTVVYEDGETESREIVPACKTMSIAEIDPEGVKKGVYKHAVNMDEDTVLLVAGFELR